MKAAGRVTNQTCSYMKGDNQFLLVKYEMDGENNTAIGRKALNMELGQINEATGEKY